jgi:SAM-dependent methyltransferase
MNRAPDRNIDERVVDDFGREWALYGENRPSQKEHFRLFEAYFSIFPFESLPAGAEGFDAGCGSGRWAEFVCGRVGKLHCIDAASSALAVARDYLAGKDNVVFHLASIDEMPLKDASQDFGYSLGVLHHIPDTGRALSDCVRKLKPGAPFLVYLYYRLENRPAWFVMLWHSSDFLRRIVCRLPFPLKRMTANVIAATVYWPLARTAMLGRRLGCAMHNLPLSSYGDASFYTMRNDALDRFGTRLEQRFTRGEIKRMMEAAGLEDIRFSETVPYWVALGRRRANSRDA